MTPKIHSQRLRSLAIVAAGSIVFVLVVVGVSRIAKSVFPHTLASGLRQRVTVELTAAMIAEIAFLLVLVLLLRRRGATLRSLGLWRPSPLRGWIVAGLVAALFVGFNLALPLRGEKNLAEVSLFHLYNAVVAAVVAGFVEETLFRGFLMTELQSSGWGNAAQVTISSLAYGAVHSAWGVVNGMFTWEMLGSAVIGTTVFGGFCAATYLASRRSLMPVIVGHGLINLVLEPWLFMVAVTMAHR